MLRLPSPSVTRTHGDAKYQSYWAMKLRLPSPSVTRTHVLEDPHHRQRDVVETPIPVGDEDAPTRIEAA